MDSLEFAIELCPLLSIALAAAGGVFALWQWSTGNSYKRALLLKDLISMLRDDEETASVFDTVDWGRDFYYDGRFHISRSGREALKHIDDANFFRMVDKMLFRLSYICYLRSRHILKREDMGLFEYSLRRISDNQHTANYLYSLYHWSRACGVASSFSFLTEYCLCRGYLDKRSFVAVPTREEESGRLVSGRYQCFLKLPGKYLS